MAVGLSSNMARSIEVLAAGPQSGPLLPERGAMTLRVHGPGQAGTLVQIRSPKCTIGSAAGCTLRLRARDVGRLHCWILRGSGGAVVRRLHGPTIVNGRAVEESLLAPGDRLRLGSVELELVELCADGAAPGEGQSPTGRIAPLPVSTTEVEARLAATLDQLQRLEAQARQGFQASITAAERADQLRDALEAADQQLEESSRELAAAQETAALQAAEIARLRQQISEQSELLQKLEQARQDAERSRQEFVKAQHAAEQARQDAEAARQEAERARQDAAAQSLVRGQLEHETHAIEAALAAERAAWQVERESLRSRLHAREAELDAVRAGAQGQSAVMTVPLDQSQPDELAAERCAALEQQAAELRAELDPLRNVAREHGLLKERFDKLAHELECQRHELGRKSTELEQRTHELAEVQAREADAAARARSQAELDERAASLARWHEELTQRAEHLASSEQALRQQREACDLQRGELEAERRCLTAEQSELAAQCEHLREREHQLAEERQRLQNLQEQLSAQREQWEARQAAGLESARRAEDLERTEAELVQRAGALDDREQALARQAADLEKLRQQLDDLREQLDGFHSELTERQASLEERADQVRRDQEQLAQERRAMAEQRASVSAAAGPSTNAPDNPAADEPPLQARDVATLDRRAAGDQSGGERQPGVSPRDSDSVNSVLSRLVQAGVWRHDDPPGEASDEETGLRPLAAPAPLPPASDALPHCAEATAVADNENGASTGAAGFAARSFPTAPASTNSDEEESIESYMQRLMQRVQGQSGTSSQPATPQRSWAPPSVPPAAPLVPEVRNDVQPPGPTEPPSEFLPRSMAPELGSNLSAMRELANSAARSAIDHHIRRRTRRQAAGRLFAACLSLGASITLGYWAWRSHSFLAAIGAALGCALGASWVAAAIRRMLKVRQLNQSDGDSDDVTQTPAAELVDAANAATQTSQ